MLQFRVPKINGGIIMKKTVISLLSVALLLPTIGIASAQASSEDTPIASGQMELTQGQTPIAPRVSVGGGTWNSGFSGTKVYSQYYHGSKKHSATAKNGWGAGVRNTQKAGIWAYSSVNSTLTGNKTYWAVY